MIRKLIFTLIYSSILGIAFGQYQVPLFAPGNSAGMSNSLDYNLISVTGQNTIGLTTNLNNKVFLGLLAPVRYVLTDAELTKAGNTQLFQNYPNPFKTQTTIPFEISKLSKVKLVVVDILGQQVEVILDQELTSGKHIVSYDAKNIKPGLFLYRLEVDNYSANKTMVVSK